MRIFTDDTSRFCYNCGFENPNQYTHCGNCGGENPVPVRRHVPQPTFVPLIVEAPKSRTIYIILGLMVGWLGIHNIYAKRSNVGAVQLILFMMFFWTIIIPFVLVVWSIVEICTVKTDGKGIPMN